MKIKSIFFRYLRPAVWLFLSDLINWALRIGFLVFVWWAIVLSVNSNLNTINPNIVVASIAAMVTVSGYFINRSSERRKVIEQQIREKKIPVYEEFISFITHLLSQKQINDKELAEFLGKFNQRAIIWMSDESLSIYITWIRQLRRQRSDGEIDSEKIREDLLKFEEVLFQFREDIGLSNRELGKGDLLTIFINDYDAPIK